MSGVNQPLKNHKPSIKYRSKPLDGAFIELKNFDRDENTPESPKCKQNHNISEHKSPQILSTRELVSAIGHVWDSTTSLLSKRNSRFVHKQSQNQAIEEYKSCNGKDSSSITHEHLEYLRVTQRTSLIELSRTFLQSSSNVSQVIQSCEVRNIYQWMNDLALITPKQDIVINNDKIEIKPAKYTNDSNIIRSSNDSSILKQTESKSNHSSNNCNISKEEKHEDLQKNDTKHDFFIQSKEKNLITTVKTKHAFAGAMAGICVSVCLHPIDTIKTIFQSCHVNQNSLHQISKSILLERGVTGLYRGISSNIASSAPISAIYTFTYESVKGALLPLFPKEYQSLAHCIAGGTASIATSFVFTPSERIKQQMQVGSHYQNCWNALIEIVGKGGLRSLYAGWGAVLCRNVPHSIIKFYMYETLKQLMFPAEQSSGQTNTLVTLTCGGLAGSTAAFFTTPFDVVKTRLQTQVPGSINQYNGVLNTLINIGKREGLKGLYRGLTPRLFMYMTQGALFFASYEFFKKLFALEVPRLNAQKGASNKQIHA